VRVIYDIHEDTRSQILLKTYIPGALRAGLSWLFGLWEDFVAKRLFALVVPQDKMLERYARINQCINLPNYVDIELYPKSIGNFDRPMLFHAGGLTIERGLLNMRAVADQLGSAGEVYIAGKLPASIRIDELGSLKYLGSLGYEDVLQWYGRANIGLILYNNVGQYHMASAVKSFEYMAASMPILLPNFGEWIDFNTRIDCGLNVDVTNPVEIVRAICYLRDHPDEARRLGQNGRAYAEKVASWQAVSGRLMDLYQEITWS
jgi:glycosyltransferase involved in cell wall biosynthesis